jgi:hypothetical protein
MRLTALFGLAFATAPPHGLTSPHTANSQAHSSKGTPSPERSRLRRIVGTRFQVLFHSPPGVLFTFPSRYLSAIGHQGVFRLRGWSPQIRTGFLGTRATWDVAREFTPFRLRGYHPLRQAFPSLSTMTRISDSLPGRQPGPDGPTTPNAQRLPAITRARFSLIRFRSPLLTESRLLSLPAGTEMFHFPAFPPHALCVQARVAEFYSTGFPHSDILGSQLGCQLLEAYRRLLRPSSAPGAKASTVCPYKLDHRYKDARVHYAVLKLRTEPATDTRRLPRTPDPATRRDPACQTVHRGSAPEHATTNPPAGARSLRTQQRARPPLHPHAFPSTPHGSRRTNAPGAQAAN